MSGYLGRLAVTEIVIADSELERSIAQNASLETLTSACRREGSRSLWDSGVTRLLTGETSADELTRVLEQEVASQSAGESTSKDMWALFDTPSPAVALYDSPDEFALPPHNPLQ
jgi:hypothetical protein